MASRTPYRYLRFLTTRYVLRAAPILVGMIGAGLALVGRKIRAAPVCQGVEIQPGRSKRALVVFDTWVLKAQVGSRRVVESQIHALGNADFEVHGLCVHQAPSIFRARIDLNDIAGLGLASAYEAGLDVRLSEFSQMARRMSRAPKGRRPLKQIVDSVQAMVWSRDLDDAVSKRPFDLVFANYVWNLPLALKVARGAPVVVETHDIQSRQIARQEGRTATEDEIASEANLLDEADAVIALNAEEHDLLSRALTAEKVFLLYPPLPVGPATSDAAAGDLIDAVGSKSPVRSLARPLDRVDAVFIGSRHAPNVHGMIWFIENVLPKVLRDLPGFTMAVAGGVVEEMAAQGAAMLLGRPGVVALGVVDRVAPLYASSKVVVVPVDYGEGISIKTIEAMAHGKAVVTTSAGLRGFPSDISYSAFDDAEGFASRILDLLSDPQVLLDAEAQSRALYSAYFTEEAHAEGFAKIFAFLGLETVEGGGDNAP